MAATGLLLLRYCINSNHSSLLLAGGSLVPSVAMLTWDTSVCRPSLRTSSSGLGEGKGRKKRERIPESTYTSTKIFPALTESHKIRRLKWSIQFWIFWDNDKRIHRRCLFLLVHMDEKWFYVIVPGESNDR